MFNETFLSVHEACFVQNCLFSQYGFQYHIVFIKYLQHNKTIKDTKWKQNVI